MLRQSKLSVFHENLDPQIKLFLDRINSIEKKFLEIGTSFEAYSRRTSKICGNKDELANVLKNYVYMEAYNESVENGLLNLSKAITILSDFNELKAQRLQIKIGNKFTHYGETCKAAKADIKHCIMMKDKENTRRRQMDQIRQRSTRERKSTTTIDLELKKSKTENSRISTEIDDIITKFEKDKVTHLISLLLDFILIEIKHHTKALEVLTAAYQDLAEVDTDVVDINDLKDTISFKEHQHGYLSHLKSQSMGALNLILSGSGGPEIDKSKSVSSESLNEITPISTKERRIILNPIKSNTMSGTNIADDGDELSVTGSSIDDKDDSSSYGSQRLNQTVLLKYNSNIVLP